MSKQCTKCLNIKELTQFSKQKSCKDGLTYQCKSCISSYMKVRTRKSFVYNQDYYLQKNYGITLEQFKSIEHAQHGVCKICSGTNTSKALHVDHCHLTGVIRGLLCNTCNRGLGLFKDNVELLAKAIEYIKR